MVMVSVGARSDSGGGGGGGGGGGDHGRKECMGFALKPLVVENVAEFSLWERYYLYRAQQ